MNSLTSAVLGLAAALAVGGAQVATAATPDATSTGDKATMDACMGMSRDAMMKDAKCVAMMKTMKMSAADMQAMKSCRAMTMDAMTKDKKCAAMMKMHPDMMGTMPK